MGGGRIKNIGRKVEKRIKKMVEGLEKEEMKEVKREWWDGECRNKKEEVRRELRRRRKRGKGRMINE